MARLRTLMLAALCMAASASAWAFTPPTWRGQAGSSYQEWRFDTAANPAAPETVSNPYGSPVAIINPGDFATGWWDSDPAFGSKQGFWDLGSGGTITATLPTLQYVEIWVEVVYCTSLAVKANTNVPNASQIGLAEQEPAEAAQPPNWYAERTKWTIPFGTDAPTVIITANSGWGSVIDRISIDALSIVLAVTDVKVTIGTPGTATVTWTTNVYTVGSVTYRAVSSATPSFAAESAPATAHNVLLTGVSGILNYAITISNGSKSEPTFYWPRLWPIPSDANMDCAVNVLDLLLVRNHLGQSVSTADNWKADVNQDGAINMLDLIFVRNRLGTKCR